MTNPYDRKLRELMGHEILSQLANPNVTDIMLNPDGKLWIDTFDGMKLAGQILDRDRIYNIICTVATMMETIVNASSPAIRGEIPFVFENKQEKRLRFQGAIPPIVDKPCFTIRVPASQVFTLSNYVEAEILDASQAGLIRASVEQRKNILVAGSTGSGKSTLLNAILSFMSEENPSERIITIEDTFELNFTVLNKLAFRTSDERDANKLLMDTLRHRPDRIVVGEVRGAECLTMIKAWNTGSSGVCSIHANSAVNALTRVEQLIQETAEPSPQVIASCVNIVIFIERDPLAVNGRRVSEIIEVLDYDHDKRKYVIASHRPKRRRFTDSRSFLYELIELN